MARQSPVGKLSGYCLKHGRSSPPNINVLAVKKAAEEPVSYNVIVDSDNGDFDRLSL